MMLRWVTSFLWAAAAFAQSSPQVSAALAAGTYFPLEIGNRWVYRVDSRAGTASYETWRIDRTQTIGDNLYFVVAIVSDNGLLGESRFRVDAQGRVFLRTGDADQLFLDSRPSGEAGVLKVEGPAGTVTSAAGTFSDTLKYSNRLNSLQVETGVLGRGVGLLSSTTVLQTGSSGGFTTGRTLVEATVGGSAIRFRGGFASLKVGMESLSLDVSGKQVTNCILPCYFAACGFAGPVPDPPGTYKPCARASVSVEGWSPGPARPVRLRLTSPDGTVLYDRVLSLVAPEGSGIVTTQIPLFSAPNLPYPPGSYRLSAATDDGAAESGFKLAIR